MTRPPEPTPLVGTPSTQVALLPGNVAKFRLLRDLRESLGNRPSGQRVLDVGCVGPSTPLELWQVLFAGDADRDVHVTGVDVGGIDRAREHVDRLGWSDRVELVEGSAYDLATIFEGRAFDLLVSTQVLEHLARYPLFLAALPEILADGGEAFLTFDSAHFGGKYPIGQPIETLKRLVKQLRAAFGVEARFDVPLHDRDVEPLFEAAGLEVVTRRYHNLGPIKFLHNHRIDESDKDDFLAEWWQLEERINRSSRFDDDDKARFRCLYYHVRKRATR